MVVLAVLTLAFAGAAHALSVDIMVPETDPAEGYRPVRVRFLAVAWDEKGNDVTDRATFTWAFPDAKGPTVGNPVLHRFPLAQRRVHHRRELHPRGADALD